MLDVGLPPWPRDPEEPGCSCSVPFVGFRSRAISESCGLRHSSSQRSVLTGFSCSRSSANGLLPADPSPLSLPGLGVDPSGRDCNWPPIGVSRGRLFQSLLSPLCLVSSSRDCNGPPIGVSRPSFKTPPRSHGTNRVSRRRVLPPCVCRVLPPLHSGQWQSN